MTPEDVKNLRPMQVQAAAKLRTGRIDDADALAIKLVGIHDDLVMAVLSGKGEGPAFLQRIGEFAADAKGIKDAAQLKIATK